jgi:hypothetical protein
MPHNYLNSSLNFILQKHLKSFVIYEIGGNFYSIYADGFKKSQSDAVFSPINDFSLMPFCLNDDSELLINNFFIFQWQIHRRNFPLFQF